MCGGIAHVLMEMFVLKENPGSATEEHKVLTIVPVPGCINRWMGFSFPLGN